MLDYLYIAETHNGHIIKQTQDDVSPFNPSNNIYREVTKENVRRFSLVGKGHVITIDLTDGHAEVDGKFVYPPKLPPVKCELKLIYYRQVQQSIGGSLGAEGTGLVHTATKMRYYIGWQAHYEGKNYKFELGID